MNSIFTIAKNIAGMIYPAICAVCKKPLTGPGETEVCGICQCSLRRNPRPYCISCGRTVDEASVVCTHCLIAKPSFSMARSACVYEGVAKELVCVFKYKNRRPLASVLAGIMIDFLKNENGIAKTAEAVTFVPLHKKRLRERDFNQSEMLGRKVAAGLSLPVIDCLEKTRQTASQNELSRNERLVNLKGAFKTRRGVSALFRDRELLLVDDVMTTGATLDECSRTLLEAGARKIRCITFARGAGNDEDNR